MCSTCYMNWDVKRFALKSICFSANRRVERSSLRVDFVLRCILLLVYRKLTWKCREQVHNRVLLMPGVSWRIIACSRFRRVSFHHIIAVLDGLLKVFNDFSVRFGRIRYKKEPFCCNWVRFYCRIPLVCILDSIIHELVKPFPRRAMVARRLLFGAVYV